MIRIHVTNTSFRAFPIELRANCVIPELSQDNLPKTPLEIIKSAPHDLMSGKDIVTCSEIFVLFVLYCIKNTTKKKITPLSLRPFNVQILYYKSAGVNPIRLCVDEEGEFIDCWPNGFFHERTILMF